jgi:hypothetical protein
MMEQKHGIHQGDRIPGFLKYVLSISIASNWTHVYINSYILSLCYAITSKLEASPELLKDKEDERAMWLRVGVFLAAIGGRPAFVQFGWRVGDRPHPGVGLKPAGKIMQKAGKGLLELLR